MARELYARTVAASMLLACCGSPARPPEPAHATERTVNEAMAFERQREYLQAQDRYQRAFDTAPDPVSKVWAGRAMASALIAWGMYSEAEEVLLKILAVDARHVPSWHDIGLLRYQRRAFIGAERAFRRSIQLRPADSRSYEALGALLVNRGRYDEAIAVYQRLQTLDVPEEKRTAAQKAVQLLKRQRALQK